MDGEAKSAKPSLRRGGRSARQATRTPGSRGLDRGTQNYTKPAASGQVCVIACGAIAHEILDIVKLNQLEHISLTCLPAKLHNTPDQITGEVKKAIDRARKAGFERIFCGYADCGTGGTLDRLLAAEKIDRLPGAHCYAFFSGVETFTQWDDLRAFYLTDFLARHFDSLTYEPLGMRDHPELVAMYFGHYEKVVFLSQRLDADTLKRAENIAKKLNLDFEHRHTGYGDLSRGLSQTVHGPTPDE